MELKFKNGDIVIHRGFLNHKDKENFRFRIQHVMKYAANYTLIRMLNNKKIGSISAQQIENNYELDKSATFDEQLRHIYD